MTRAPLRIAVITVDRTLGRICELELRAMGYAEVECAESFGALSRTPDLWISDCRGADVPDGIPGVLCVSSEEEISVGERRVLRRPLSLEAFRNAVRTAEAESSLLTNREDQGAPPRRAILRGRARARTRDGAEPLSFSMERREILLDDTHIALTPGEAAVFSALYDADGGEVSRESLRVLLDAGENSNLPDVHVCAIRKKLAEHGRDGILQTLRRRGYCLSRR